MGLKWFKVSNRRDSTAPAALWNDYVLPYGDQGQDAEEKVLRLDLLNGANVLPPEWKQSDDYNFVGLSPADQYHPVVQHVHLYGLQLSGERIFRSGISFLNVVFHCEVNLERVRSYGPLFFWNCTFKKNFTIANADIRQGVDVDNREEGEANFSYCVFEGQADFRRAVFHGKTYFHKTVFAEGADFSGAKFKEAVVFEASESDVCLPKDELEKNIAKAISKHLRNEPHPTKNIDPENLSSARYTPEDLARTVVDYITGTGSTVENETPHSTDTRVQRRHKSVATRNQDLPDNFLNFDLTIASGLDLKDRLAKLTPQKLHPCCLNNALSVVQEEWAKRYRTTMFSGVKGLRVPFADITEQIFDEDRRTSARDLATKPKVDFSEVEFHEGSAFGHADLSRCLFNGAEVAKVSFVVCQWPEFPCNPVLERLIGRVGKLWYLVRNRITIVPSQRAGHQYRGQWTTWRRVVRDEIELRASKVAEQEADKQLDSPDRRRKAEEATRQRLAIYNERGRYSQVSELYRELRVDNEQIGDPVISRDFYFGELESQRLSQKRQKATASYAYKVLAGYSRQEGLAALWLVFWLFLFSALFFFISGGEHRLLQQSMGPGYHGRVPITSVPSITPAESKAIASDREPIQSVLAKAAVMQIKQQQGLDPWSEDKDVLQKADEALWGRAFASCRKESSGLQTAGHRVVRYLSCVNSTWSAPFFSALGSSLHASTFLTTSAAPELLMQIKTDLKESNVKDDVSRDLAKYETLRRLLEATERLLVLSQIGLIFLCLRSRFQRAV